MARWARARQTEPVGEVAVIAFGENGSVLRVAWASEVQLELTERGGARGRRRPGCEAMFGEQARDGVSVGGDFEPQHGSAAASAGFQVGPKYVREKPGPAGAFCVVVLARGWVELKLIAWRGRRAALGGVV
jgi:hypothetical protein